MEKTNMADLVNDVLRYQERAADPGGWETFVQAFKPPAYLESSQVTRSGGSGCTQRRTLVVLTARRCRQAELALFCCLPASRFVIAA